MLPRRLAPVLFGAILLALPALAAASVTAVALTPTATDSNGHTTHTITIGYNAGANPQWSYTISPENDAKNARVKRHDTILWKCDGGKWEVFFKGATPLADSSGAQLPQVSGGAGASAGGKVDGKVKKGDVFTYGVSLLLPGASEPVVDDPRIVIEK